MPAWVLRPENRLRALQRLSAPKHLYDRLERSIDSRRVTMSTNPPNTELGHRFAFHPATTEERQQAHEGIRSVLGDAANYVKSFTPDGREQALALTKLEEAMFWANAAIARQGGDK
jgi:hypothetical protein